MNYNLYILISLILIFGFVIYTTEKIFLSRAKKEAERLFEDTEIKKCDLYSPKEEHLAQADGIEKLKDDIIKLKIQLKELTNPDNGI